MNPTDIVFKLRGRDHYEAIDLGFRLVQRWWRQLYLLWLLWLVPLAVIAVLLMPDPGYAGILLWWLKPMYERSQLYFLSRAVFGTPPSIRETIRQTPKMAAIQWFASLTWRRLSPSRSFDLPVIQLEGQRGTARSKRLRVLHQSRCGSTASWLTTVGIHIESFFSLAIMALIFMLLPQNIELDWEFFLDSSTLTFVCSLLAMTMVGPLYVAGGFALYLNRRIMLEGWDLELIFQQLSQRQQPAASNRTSSTMAMMLGFCLLSVLWFTAPPPAQAEPITPETAKDDIQTILDGPDFHTIKTTRLPKFMQDDSDQETPKPADFDFDPSFLIEHFAQLFKLLLWGLLIGLILYLLYRYRDALLALSLPKRSDRLKAEQPAPTHLFDLDIREQSLPDELVQEAAELWQRQAYREALALLYRGGLSRLVNDRDLRLSRGATEEDCVALVQAREQQELSTYFARLARAWQTLAYAHQLPSTTLFSELCQHWNTHFGHHTTGETSGQ